MKQVLVFTKLGLVVRYKLKAIRLSGRCCQGVLSMKLRKNDAVVAAIVVDEK